MAFVLMLCLCPAPCRSETNQATVLDGSGGWASNGTFTAFAAAFQPCPVGVNTNPAYLNGSGFLHMFLLHPGLDHDGDGIADEDDPDDDNDGLTDAGELSGIAFNPVTRTDAMAADSDSDGMTDSEEAAAGSNPWDAGSLLRIVSISVEAGLHTITWQSREGYTYELVFTNRVDDLDVAPIAATVTAAGGAAPWYETVSAATNAPGSSNTFYRVRLTGQP